MVSKTSRNGILFIACREALVLTAYQDGPHLSIGFGSNDPSLKPGDTISAPAAFARLRDDVAKREPGLAQRVQVSLTQSQWDALISLHFQSGNRYMPVAARAAGDDRPDILRLINAGKMDEAAAVWPDCDANLAGQKSAGLRKRRLLEQAVWAQGDYGDLTVLPYWPGDPRKTRMQQYRVKPEDI